MFHSICGRHWSVRVGSGVGRCFIPKREGIGRYASEKEAGVEKEAGDDMV